MESSLNEERHGLAEVTLNYTAFRTSSRQTCTPNLIWRTILVSATLGALLFLASCTNKTASGQHATILMRDGTTLTGIITATSPAEITLAGADNATHTVPMTQVKSIEYDEAPVAQSSATQTSDANSGTPATPTRRSAASRADDAAHAHHYHPTQAEIHTKTYVLPVGTKVPVRRDEPFDAPPAAEGRP